MSITKSNDDECFISLHSFMCDDNTYFIKATISLNDPWEVVVTDGTLCWNGYVAKTDMSTYASETNMETAEYISLMKRALTGMASDQDFEYAVCKQQNNSLELQWKKVVKDVKFCLGKLTLQQSTNANCMEIYLAGCTRAVKQASDASETYKLESKKLSQDYLKTVENLSMCTTQKQALESELLAKFVLVLNEKKCKIQKLQQQTLEYKNEIVMLKKKLAMEGDSYMETTKSTGKSLQTSTIVNLQDVSSSDNDSQDDCPVFTKKKKQSPKKLSSKPLSPVRLVHDVQQAVTEPHLSDAFTTTSSDATEEIDDLIDEM